MDIKVWMLGEKVQIRDINLVFVSRVLISDYIIVMILDQIIKGEDGESNL